MSTKPDAYILVAREHDLLFPGSETALLAAQLTKIAQREREEVPEFLQKDAPEQKTDASKSVGPLVPMPR